MASQHTDDGGGGGSDHNDDAGNHVSQGDSYEPFVHERLWQKQFNNKYEDGDSFVWKFRYAMVVTDDG